MTKKTSENQVVDEKDGVVEETTAQATGAEAGANMADGTEASTDTVAEEPKVEEIDWKDIHLEIKELIKNSKFLKLPS